MATSASSAAPPPSRCVTSSPGRRLQIGEVAYRQSGGKWTASFYYRNNQGQRRRIEATWSSKTAARREALAALDRVMASGGLGRYTERTTFAQVAEQWYAQIERLVEQDRRSPTTLELYRRTLDLHVLPAICGLRLSELSVARLDTFLHVGQLRNREGVSCSAG